MLFDPNTQPALPEMVSDHLAWTQKGFAYVAGEMSHAVALLDRGEVDRARAVLVEALAILDREMARH